MSSVRIDNQGFLPVLLAFYFDEFQIFVFGWIDCLIFYTRLLTVFPLRSLHLTFLLLLLDPCGIWFLVCTISSLYLPTQPISTIGLVLGSEHSLLFRFGIFGGRHI